MEARLTACVLALLVAASLVLADNAQLPGTPTKFKRVSVGWSSFNISWEPPDPASSGPVTHYSVEVYDPQGIKSTHYTPSRTLSVDGLNFGTLYTLRIYAENGAGRSQTPLNNYVTTKSDVPTPDSPEILNERRDFYYEAHINLTWSTPAGHGLPVLMYEVWKKEWKVGERPGELKRDKVLPFGTNNQFYQLKWDWNYHFAIAATNQFKKSDFTANSIIALTVSKGPLGSEARVPGICHDIVTYQKTLSPYGSYHYIDTEPEVIRSIFNSTATPFNECSAAAKWYLCTKYFPRIDQRSGTRLPPCFSFCDSNRGEIWPCRYKTPPRIDECGRLPTVKCLDRPGNASQAPPCSAHVTGNEESYGIRRWPQTGARVRARLYCPFGPEGSFATRQCLLSGVWGREDLSACRADPTAIHQSLKNLSKVVVTEDNLQEVSKELLDLTKQTESLESNDISEAAAILENIVDNGNKTLSTVGQDVVTIVNNLILVNSSTLMNAQERFQSSARIVKSLEKYTETVPMSGSASLQFQSDNLIIQAVDTSTLSQTGIEFGTANDQPDQSTGHPDKASIKLPREVLAGQAAKRVAFIEYFKSTLFRTSRQHESQAKNVNSHVIAASIKDTELTNLQTPVEMVFYLTEASPQSSCVFWDFKALEGTGAWSSEGCTVASSDAEKTVCHCNHLTNFAVLMDVDPQQGFSRSAKLALSLISYIGCGLSILGLTLTLLTLLIFRELRTKTPNRILISLCMSLLLVLLVFLAGIERTEVVWVCRGVAVLLHYFILVTFSWMGVEALNMYLLFVKVMPTKTTHFFLKCSVVSWGLPAVLVAISVAASEESYGGKDICRVTGVPFYVAFLLPVLLIILGNFVVFVMVQRSLSSSKSVLTADKKSAGKQNFRRATAITVLLGLTWLFGVLAVKDAKLVFQFLFCIFNAFQGFLIFLFYCLLQPSLRRRWRHCLTGKEKPAKCDAKSRSSMGMYHQNQMDRFTGSRNGSSANYTSKTSSQGLLGNKL